jgi:uncharacterized integral membrane protein
MATCPSCKKDVADSVRSCPYCGEKVEVKELGIREAASIQEKISKARRNEVTAAILCWVSAVLEITSVVLADIRRTEYQTVYIRHYHPYTDTALGFFVAGILIGIPAVIMALHYRRKFKKLRGKLVEQIGEGVPYIEPISGGAKKILNDALKPGEPLYVLAKGALGSYIAATDSRVILIKTGPTGGSFLKPLGKKCNILPYEQISAIDYEWSRFAGTLQITTSGIRDRKVSLFGGNRADNLIAFDKGSMDKFRLIRDRITRLRETAQSKASSAVVAESIPDQIKKLAELRDAGILSSEEFETKKSELLKRM